VTDLGTLPGASQSSAAAINEHGEIAGTAIFSAPGAPATAVHAVRWDPDGAIHDLGPIGTGNAMVRGIDEDGRIVGVSDLDRERAFVYEPATGAMQPLADLPGDVRSSTAWGMNDVGDVVGYQRLGEDWLVVPVRWDLDTGTVEDLTDEWGTAAVYAINDAGVEVGVKPYGEEPDRVIDAAVRHPGAAPERLFIGHWAFPTAIDEAGTVVGYVPTGSGCTVFRWDPVRGRRDLSPDGAVGIAWGGNDRGQTVGQLDDRAVLFVDPPAG
jgi:uncharacterized membrane protein